MKTKNNIKYLMILAVIGITIISSCRKKKDEMLDKDTSAASDNAFAESMFNDVNNIADEGATGSLASYLRPSNLQEKGVLSNCATVTIDTITGSNHTIIVDFGSANCLCNDGRYRRGIINIAFTGRYRDSLSTHTITFTNYFVNDNQILGTKTVTNNGHNNSGHLTFTVVVNGQIVRTNNGGIISWTANRSREWILGEGTPQWSDDSYLITGSSSGSSAAGYPFTSTITSALRRDLGCHHFVSGTLEIAPANKPVRYVDFGNGTCDNQATVTINGNTFNITLR